MRTDENPIGGSRQDETTTLPLDFCQPYGSLEHEYRSAYERLLRGSRSDNAAVILDPLARAMTTDVRLGDGLQARFTYLPGRDAWPGTPFGGPREDPRALMRVVHDRLELIVLARRLPYVPEQSLFVPSSDLPQDLDAAPLAAAFAFSWSLGGAYTFFFNKGGMTYDRFHAQCFRGSPPLWDAIEQKSAPILRERFSSNGVQRGSIGRWPALVQGLRSSSISDLTAETIAEVRRLEARGLTYDLTWRPIDNELCVLIFVRGRSTDDEFDTYSPERKELGMFGALELSGWIVSIKDESVFTRLVGAPEELARRYTAAVVNMRPRRGATTRSTADAPIRTD